jgi:hypothetical protein
MLVNEDESSDSVSTLARPVRFALESDYGFLININEELGDHLLLWSTREGAERMVPSFAGLGRYWVTEVDNGELVDELALMQEDGMRFVLLDAAPEASGQALPIQDAIAFYAQMGGPPKESVAASDHFIRRLERVRARGEKIDAETESMPVDCPMCRMYFTLTETEYRNWRDGRVEMIRCTKCQTTFREAVFERVKCADCGVESGPMPRSLARGMSRGELPWRCFECADAALHEIANPKPMAVAKRRIFGDDWYPIVVGGLGFIALIAGLILKFFFME